MLLVYFALLNFAVSGQSVSVKTVEAVQRGVIPIMCLRLDADQKVQFARVEAGGNQSVTFMSFSKNPRLIFWDKDGALNYYAVVYSGEFIEHKDYENLTFDLERYRVGAKREPQLVSTEQNIKCE